MNAPLRYIKVKDYILQGIAEGQWPVGAKVPSENELVKTCEVSRMTARRALNELTTEGRLERIQGKGTFVADSKHKSSLIAIRNIATEIRERGNNHKSELLKLESVVADEWLAMVFDIAEGATLYHSTILHRENDETIQVEDRYVSPHIAPDYLQQDFNKMTPNEYLCLLAPISEAQHIIEAISPDEELSRILELESGEACLKVTRTTWCSDAVASYAYLYHPGSRYQLGSRFTPN